MKTKKIYFWNYNRTLPLKTKKIHFWNYNRTLPFLAEYKCEFRACQIVFILKWTFWLDILLQSWPFPYKEKIERIYNISILYYRIRIVNILYLKELQHNIAKIRLFNFKLISAFCQILICQHKYSNQKMLFLNLDICEIREPAQSGQCETKSAETKILISMFFIGTLPIEQCCLKEETSSKNQSVNS